jgi:CheY-specific phosphatase CheX
MLKDALIKSTQNFTKEVLDAETPVYESCPLYHAYSASIEIEGDENYHIAVHIAEKSLKKMAYLFLFEENPDAETLEDLIKEISNIIVGKAKLHASQSGLSFTIKTPQFLGANIPIEQNDFDINFTFEDEIFSITGRVS